MGQFWNETKWESFQSAIFFPFQNKAPLFQPRELLNDACTCVKISQINCSASCEKKTTHHLSLSPSLFLESLSAKTIPFDKLFLPGMCLALKEGNTFSASIAVWRFSGQDVRMSLTESKDFQRFLASFSKTLNNCSEISWGELATIPSTASSSWFTGADRSFSSPSKA